MNRINSIKLLWCSFMLFLLYWFVLKLALSLGNSFTWKSICVALFAHYFVFHHLHRNCGRFFFSVEFLSFHHIHVHFLLSISCCSCINFSRFLLLFEALIFFPSRLVTLSCPINVNTCVNVYMLFFLLLSFVHQLSRLNAFLVGMVW